MRKRGFTQLVVIVMMCILMFMLTACATKLSGTYTNDEGLIKQSFTFKDDNIVEVSAFGINVEGTYLTENGKIVITYKLLNFSYNWEKSFEKAGNSIFIDGTEFIKE